MEITNKDQELIDIATKIVTDNKDLYNDLTLVVACAIRGKSGKIYSGINIKTSHSICAEQVAIGQAFANGERELETIVAVKLERDGNPRVVSPCGLCRYTFDKLNLDCNVIVEDEKNGATIKVKAADLLPYPYKRNI